MAVRLAAGIAVSGAPRTRSIPPGHAVAAPATAPQQRRAAECGTHYGVSVSVVF